MVLTTIPPIKRTYIIHSNISQNPGSKFDTFDNDFVHDSLPKNTTLAYLLYQYMKSNANQII